MLRERLDYNNALHHGDQTLVSQGVISEHVHAANLEELERGWNGLDPEASDDGAHSDHGQPAAQIGHRGWDHQTPSDVISEMTVADDDVDDG